MEDIITEDNISDTSHEGASSSAHSSNVASTNNSQSAGALHSRALQASRVGLSRLPAEAGGIALNCAGMGSWLSAMCELHGPQLLPLYDVGSALFVGLACVILAGMALQALVHNAHLRGELRKPKQCGSYGGLLMSLSLSASYIRFVTPTGSRVPYACVHLAAALQVAMVLWYLGWASKIRSPPVPYWCA